MIVPFLLGVVIGIAVAIVVGLFVLSHYLKGFNW